MKLIGSNGYDVGSPEYFRNINENTVIGYLMEEFSEGLACSDYADAVDKLCKRVTEVIEEVYWDLRKYADVLPYFPQEERENTLKFLERINDVFKFGYSGESSKFDACKAYLTLSAYDTRRKSYESMSRVEEAAKKVENGGSVRMSYSTAFELVRKALDYGISYTAGDDLTKMTFFNDILEGKDRDFLQDVYNCLRFKKDKSSLYGKCFKTILSRDYIQELENKALGKMYNSLKQYNSYYECIKANLDKICDIFKVDIIKGGYLDNHSYIDNVWLAAKSMDRFLNTDLSGKFKDLSLNYEVIDITDELHALMDNMDKELWVQSFHIPVNGKLPIFHTETLEKFIVERIMAIPPRAIIPKLVYNIQKGLKFIDLVETGGDYDLKNIKDSEWDHEYFIYEGKEIRGDGPGNIAFGYIAKLFGYDETFAKWGAGIYQKESGTSRPEFEDSFGDDPYDQEMIELGYDYYDRTHSGTEVSFFKETREIAGEDLVDYLGEKGLRILKKYF